MITEVFVEDAKLDECPCKEVHRTSVCTASDGAARGGERDCLISELVHRVSPASSEGSRTSDASYVVRIIDRALLARSAHNLVVEAVDLRLDTTTPLAGAVIYPAVDLLLGRLQVTALDDRPGWGLRRGDADEERKR